MSETTSASPPAATDSERMVDIKSRYREVRTPLQKWHRALAWLLILPFFGWALTGLVFLLRPGYEQAYQVIKIPTYPFSTVELELPESEYLEVRQFKTVLGTHLLVHDDQGWRQLWIDTLEPRPEPNADDVQLLVEDAIRADADRYGEIAGRDGSTLVTANGVELEFDWRTMTLTQRGRDTRLIDLLYEIHYLRWTGDERVDRYLGPAGLVLLMGMIVTGAALLVRRRRTG